MKRLHRIGDLFRRVFSTFSLFPPDYREIDTSFQAQAEDMAKIWEDVGGHMYAAIGEYEKENFSGSDDKTAAKPSIAGGKEIGRDASKPD